MIQRPFSSPTSKLPLEDVPELANKYIENARKDNDPKKALKHSNNAKALMKDAIKIFTAKKDKDSIHSKDITNAYYEHGKLLDELKHHDKAQKSHIKAGKWRYLHAASQHTGTFQPTARNGSIGRSLFPTAAFSATPNVAAAMNQGIPEIQYPSYQQNTQGATPIVVGDGIPAPSEEPGSTPQNHFEWDVTPPAAKYDLPKVGERISSTPQLAYCLALISPSFASNDGLGENERDWIQVMTDEPDEQKRLHAMATNLVRAFVRDELKKPDAIAEVAALAAILQQDDFQRLLQAFVDGIDRSAFLKVHLLDGLAQLIRNAPQGYMGADDLVKILELLNARLTVTHKQSVQNIYQLTQAISQVLDSMVDNQVEGLSREQLHEPLLGYLRELQKSPDPFLIYQAAYAYQALLYVPDDESILQSMMRRTGEVVQGISGVVSAVKALDLVGFVDGLQRIQKGLTGAEKVMGLVGNAYEDVRTLSGSGQGLFESLKKGLSFSRKSSWYPALRCLDKLHQEGRFTEFEKLYQDAPCKRDPAFQLGFCQRLGEIAANPIWDVKIRKCAILFMVDLYNDDARRGCPAYTKQWILSLFNQLAQSPHDVVANDIQRLLHELQTNGGANRAVHHEWAEKYHISLYSTKFIPPPRDSPLLDCVQNKVDVETPLRELRRERLKREGGNIYISTRARANSRAIEDFDLTSKVQEFFESNKTVFLILGDSGAGKSTFIRALETSLWDKYEIGGRIPLFVHLPSLNNPERDLIAKRLRQANFTEDQVRELKLHREFILICDGYDEIQCIKNLYMSNRLNQWGEWRVQMLISCRTEYNNVDYKGSFQPTERNSYGRSELFQEATIVPFNKGQIQEYIDKYVSLKRPTWRSEDYQQAFQEIPNLRDLIGNPFLLHLSLEVLPQLLSTNNKYSTTHITRVHLYDEFVTQWIKRGEERLREMELDSQGRDAFRKMMDSGFKQYGITYMKELVQAIYEKKDGNPEFSYSEHETWKKGFSSSLDGENLWREVLPLTRNGNRYRFIHKSILEYELTLAIYDPNDHNEDTDPPSAVSYGRRTRSILCFEQPSAGNSEVVDEKALLNTPLGRRNIIGEKSVIQFLAERVKQQPIFEDQLHSIVERSKVDTSVSIAAANAITILVRAGVPFDNKDLRNIKIPGADLSFGVFDSARMEGADLREAKLRNIWMRQANLRGAQMTGVQFGELPFLQEERGVLCCAYSPDGKIFAVGLSDGDIGLYGTSSWSYIQTLSGHGGVAMSLSFSATGDHVVSGSNDRTVRLWNVDTGGCICIFSGHTGGVNSVGYSPKGTLIASGSNDKTVRLWDRSTGDCIFTLRDHNDCVLSVAFSPKGNQIASAGNGKTVRLWDTDTGVCVHAIRGHYGGIHSVAYSPKGDRIASGSSDRTVRLWNIDTGNCVMKFYGHVEPIRSLAFSPNGDLITSGSNDGTVKLWGVDTSECLSSFQGHANSILSVVYSPNGDWIASGSLDKTVRLWDVNTREHTRTSQGHRNIVRSVGFSPNGDQIVSGSDDNTIRLWNVGTGDCVCTLQGHTGDVDSVVYSPNGNRIASGSDDKTVRIWDVNTGQYLGSFQGHSDRIRGVTYSPNGYWIASGSNDKTIRLWNPDTGENITTLLGHMDGINSIAASPNGDRIVSGSDDNTVRLWDVDSTSCFHTLSGHGSLVWSVAYSPNGNLIASGSSDSTVRLWGTDTGNCIHKLQGHTNAVRCVAFSPNGDQIASGSYDKTVRLWGVNGGQCLITISALGGVPYTIAWNKTFEDQYLVAGCDDKVIRCWQVVKERRGQEVILCWMSPHESLMVGDVAFDGAQGLSRQNRDLLAQRS